MSSIAASPNPCLVAILLVTQARPGDPAQIIFHYPPDPFKYDGAKSLDDDDDAAAGESSSDTSSYSSDDPDQLLASNAKTKADKAPSQRKDKGPSLSRSSSQHGEKSLHTENWQPPWHPLLGLGEENLVSLLAPGRTWHKRKFEMAINDLTFVGRPVYARENGTWSRQRRKKTTKTGSSDSAAAAAAAAAADPTSESDVTEDANESLSPPPRAPSPSPASPKKSLTMFHLVCVLDPPPLQQDLRVRKMYDHVAKRLSKVLKIEQAKNNYVWEQSELIQRLRAVHLTSPESVDSYYSHVARRSALANAIVSTYRAISQSQVAAVAFSPRVSISMQIPPLTSTSYLPSLTEPPIKPGLWLTTVNQAPPANSDFDPASTSSTLHLAKNTTLLLQESPQKILKGLQEPEGPLVRALTIFLEKLRSTKSFYALSIASKLSLSDIQLLARHLIYWRRAVAIPPLHHRDTYIVSPNADMAKLGRATKAFEASFPMTPSLPKILHLLSQTPTPYGRLIPSSDHKEEYYRVLAWLLRGGWVTQLCTFAYVRVDPRVKKAVRKNDDDDDRRHHHHHRLAREATAAATTSSTYNSTLPSPSKHHHGHSMASSYSPSLSSDGRPSVATTTNTTTTTTSSHDPNSASIILSPLRASVDESKWLAFIADSLLFSPSSSSPSPSSSSPLSSPSNSPPSHSHSFSPSPSTNLNNNTQNLDQDDKDSEHTPPAHQQQQRQRQQQQQNNQQQQQQQQPSLTLEQRQELRKYWNIFVKYFNGTEALEFIPKREGVKRNVFWELMGRMGLEISGDVAGDTLNVNTNTNANGSGSGSGNGNGNGSGNNGGNDNGFGYGSSLTGKRLIAVRHW